MPITGWHLPGGLLYGLIWLVFIDPLVLTVCYWAAMALITPVALMTAVGRLGGRKGAMAATAVVLVLAVVGVYLYQRSRGRKDVVEPRGPAVTLMRSPVPTCTGVVAPASIPLSTYVNEDAGLAIGYPAAWSIQTGPTSAAVDWSTGAPAYGITFTVHGVDALPKVNIAVITVAATASDVGEFEAFLDRFESSLAKDQRVSAAEVVGSRDHLTLDGRAAVVSSYALGIKGVGDVLQVVMLTASDKHFYLVTWSSRRDEQCETIGRFRSMVETLRFVP